MSDLDFLLNPSSVAIVGASDNADKIGGRPIYYMRKHGYLGKVFPINPQRPEVQGQKAWPSIESLPEVPDLAIIAVPGDKAVQAVDECAALGVKGAIVISAGFSEVGQAGREIQDAMTERARHAGMRIVGPNTQGLANFGNGAIASFSTMFLEVEPADGPVAIISQSGGMGSMIYGLVRQRGIGVRHLHATGNQADVTVSDLALAALSDPEVRIILLYLESLQDPEILAEAARVARRKGVSIVAVKAGRSEVGLRAAASHTGALANEDRTVSAFFEAHGITRAKDPHELVRFSELFIRHGSVAGPRVVIISNSGASCVLASDAADEEGLEVATLSDATQNRLSGFLSEFATRHNPIDITAALLSNNRLFGEVLTAIADDPAADLFLIDIPVAGRGYDVVSFARDAANFASQSGKPVAVVAWQELVAREFRALGVPVFDDEQQAMAAFAALLRHSRYADQDKGGSDAMTIPGASLANLGEGVLSEANSLGILAQNSVPVVPHKIVSNAREAIEAWESFGQPVVLKACSEKIPHKSDYGLVALGLQSAQAIESTLQSQMSTLIEMRVTPDGWIVAPMHKGLCEMMVGMHVDPVFGPVVVFGAGGKYVEAVPDVAVLLAPCGAQDVLEKLKGLRIWPILQGVRGEPAADIDAFVQLVVDFAKFAHRNAASLVSVDVNPVMLGKQGDGAVAVDALVELA
ncbi:MAG: acetate--CoA ligase family protein [Burkholderiaceae bacterium]|nr:acetate--CoA ligase family protein [Burkholderiaceae bacterium]MCD8516418.1 acetate--CoA ligase family protein [Burkholderiaceae bacterium]MCD8536849.1 acetate--CoA ligase family protein [Burkholderiaceae bacterium]MCD8565479.1 acetate--CoA ligase family protein [Burkholderiaceae bacterium]